MSRKASVMVYIILAAWIGAVAWAIINATYIAPKVKPQFTYVGESALSVYANENEAYKKLAYIQSSAHFSLQRALYELPKKLDRCSSHGEYPVWFASKSCIPAKDKIDNALKQLFIDSFSKKLEKHSESGVTAEQYEYSVINNKHLIFLGIATGAARYDLQLQAKETVLILEVPDRKDLPDFVPFPCAAESQQYVCKLRPEAYQKLVLAQNQALKAGHELIVNSAYRSAQEQQTLCGGKTKEGKCTNPLAALPEASAHQLGGAVDVRLKFKGIRSACGTVSSHKSKLNDYADALDANGILIHACRKELSRIMAQAGFVNLASEWWHWEYGTPLWAQESSKTVKASVKPIYTT